MTTEKTEMQFPYSPPDFFEAEYSRQTDEYILVANSGVVRITLCVPIGLALFSRTVVKG
jgi:hypothetical protein